MFIVQEGKVKVTKKVADGVNSSWRRWSAVIFSARWACSTRSRACYLRRARAATRLLAIRSGDLLIELRRDPTFALEMLQSLSRRVRYLDDQVAKLTDDQLSSRRKSTSSWRSPRYRGASPQGDHDMITSSR